MTPVLDVTPARRPVAPPSILRAENALVFAGWILMVGAVVAALAN